MAKSKNIEVSSKDVEKMLRGYVECALWSCSIGEANVQYAAMFNDGEDPPAEDASFEYLNFGPEDIAVESMRSMLADCAAFLAGNAPDVEEFCFLGHDLEQVGHDFWLTRNRHGAGFWDRGAGVVGERLSKAAKVYGESNLYLGDDGEIYVS